MALLAVLVPDEPWWGKGGHCARRERVVLVWLVWVVARLVPSAPGARRCGCAGAAEAPLQVLTSRGRTWLSSKWCGVPAATACRDPKASRRSTKHSDQCGRNSAGV